MRRNVLFTALLGTFLMVPNDTEAQVSEEYSGNIIAKAFTAINEYKNGNYHVKNSKTPYYLDYKKSEKFTEKPNGDCTYFAWGSGLDVGYDYDKYDFSKPFKVEGMRNRPTGSTTLTITNQGIVVKTYNDVQYATEFYSNTGDVWKEGSAKKPADPYLNSLGCKTGNHSSFLYFTIGGKEYKCKVTTNCKHSSKRLVIQTSSKRYDVKKHDFIVGGNDPGGESDFLSPWKFMHSLTIQVSFDSMAKAVGVSKQELFNLIVKNGITGIYTSEYSFWIEPEFDNVLLYRIAKIKGLNGSKPIKKDIADEENAKRERTLQQMNTAFEQANSEYKAGNDKYLSQPEEAYQHFKKAVAQSLDVNKNAIEYDKKEMISSSYQLWLHSTQMAVQSSYAMAIKNSQHISAFKADYKAAKKNLPYGAFGSINENIGNKAFKAGSYEEAIDFFDIAIDSYHSTKEMNQFEPIPSAGKALCLSILGRKNDALDLIDKTLSLCPDEIYPNEVKGRIYIKNGKKKQAKQWWEKTVLPKFKEKAYETKFYKLLMEEGILK